MLLKLFKKIFKKNKKVNITANKIDNIKNLLLENTDKIKNNDLFSILIELTKENKKNSLPGFSPYLNKNNINKKYDINITNVLKLKNYGTFNGNNLLFSILNKIIKINVIKENFFRKSLILVIGIVGLISLHLGTNVFMSYQKTNKQAIIKLKKETKDKDLFKIKKEILIKRYGKNWNLKYLYLFNTFLLFIYLFYLLNKTFLNNKYPGGGNYLTFIIYTNIIINILEKANKDINGNYEINYFDIKQILKNVLYNLYLENYLTYKDYIILYYNINNYTGKRYKDYKIIVNTLYSLQKKGEIYGFKGILQEVIINYYEKTSFIEEKMKKLNEQYNNLPLYISTAFFVAINVYSITVTMQML